MAYIHHFDWYSAWFQKGKYRLLLFDGQTTHLTRQFLEVCEERDIHVFVFPSHLTHLLQPLDVGVFQPYKHWYKAAVTKLYYTGGTSVDCIDFLNQIHRVRL